MKNLLDTCFTVRWFFFLALTLPTWAGDQFGYPLTGAALQMWQVQGEYHGTIAGGGNLGAWLVANDQNKYTVVFLPGGLLTLPGQPYGGWNRSGWDRNSFLASGTLSGTTFAATSANGYKATTITGTGEAKVLTGTTNTGAAFTLNRVVRKSPTYRMKPKPEWGKAVSLFDSVTGKTDRSKWAPWGQGQVWLTREVLNRGVYSSESFGGGFLHIEVQGSFSPGYTGQGRSNSGVYLQGHYEAQVLDSFGNDGTIDEFGALYGVKAPLVNAALPPLTWATYDIYFTPRTSGGDGDAAGAAVMTVYANGVLVQDATPVKGVTTAGVGGSLIVDAPLYLQDHGSEVVYNNIWYIPGATLSSLPYSSLAGGSTSIAGPSISPKATGSGMVISGWNGSFDLNGRSIPRNGSVLSLKPVSVVAPSIP